MTEVKDIKQLIYKTLDQQGILANIQAQIRATVYRQIDEQESNRNKESPFYWENPKCQKLFLSEEGKFALKLIKEFLMFYDMDYTVSVFSQESNLKDDIDRKEIFKKLNMNEKPDKPVLLYVIETFQKGESIVMDHYYSPTSDHINKESALQRRKSPSSVQPVTAGVQKKKSLKGKADSKKNNIKSQHEQPHEPKTSVNKYSYGFNPVQNDPIEEKSNDYQEDFEQVEEDLGGFDEVELEDDDEKRNKGNSNNKEKKNNPFLASNDDFGNSIGASQSLGYDQTVDSMALENYDYYENISKKKKK